jgi:Universal stress protein family
MFGTILIGVDGSGHADYAVQTVAKIAAETKDMVVVFHGVAVHQAKGTTYTTEARSDAQHLVDHYVAQLTTAGVSAVGEVHRELAIGIGGALVGLGCPPGRISSAATTPRQHVLRHEQLTAHLSRSPTVRRNS